MSSEASRPMSAFPIASLVLGVLGIVLFGIPFVGFVLGAAASVFGIIGIGKANRGESSGRGIAIAGLVLGVVALSVGVLILLTVTMTWSGSGGTSTTSIIGVIRG